MEEAIKWLWLAFTVPATILGFVASVYAIQDRLERRRKKREATPQASPVDPKLAKAIANEERVLIEFSKERKATPGTMENYVYNLLEPLPAEYKKFDYIFNPYGNIRYATAMRMRSEANARSWVMLMVAVPVISIGLVLLALGLSGELVDPVTFLVAGPLPALIGVVPLYFAWRATQRRTEERRNAEQIVQAYVDYLNENGIVAQTEFTQLRSKRQGSLQAELVETAIEAAAAPP